MAHHDIHSFIHPSIYPAHLFNKPICPSIPLIVNQLSIHPTHSSQPTIQSIYHPIQLTQPTYLSNPYNQPTHLSIPPIHSTHLHIQLIHPSIQPANQPPFYPTDVPNPPTHSSHSYNQPTQPTYASNPSIIHPAIQSTHSTTRLFYIFMSNKNFISTQDFFFLVKDEL